MKNYNHDYKTWGITLDYYNQKGTKPIIWGKTNSDFWDSLPQNIKIKNYIDDKTEKDFDTKVLNVFNNKVNEIIDGIIAVRPMLKHDLNFGWLLTSTKEELRKAVCLVMQSSIENSWSEITTASSYSTTQLSFSRTLSNWTLAGSQQNATAWNALINSQVDKYYWIEADVIFNKTPNGNIQILGYQQLDKLVKELT